MRLKIKKRWLGRIFLIGFSLSALLLALQRWDPPPMQVFRMRQLDVFQQIKPREKKKYPVIIVDIDDDSLKKYGQWPWPRTLIARLLKTLMAGGAASVGFDIIFAEPDRLSPGIFADNLRGIDANTKAVLKRLPSNDAILARAFKRSRVVLGMGAIPEERPETVSKDARKTALGSRGGDPKPFLWRLGGLVRNVPILEKNAQGIGTTTIIPEFDKVVRRIPVLWRVGDQIFPSLGIEMLRVATGQRVVITKVDKFGLQSVVVAGVEIPTDEHGMSWIRYNDHDPARFVSAGDVLSGKIPKQRFRGQLVLVGASASGLNDVEITPVHDAMPGVEIHAQWLETVLSKSFLKRPNYILGAEYLLTGAFCLILLVVVPLAGALVGFITGIGGVGGVIYLAWYFFDSQGVLLGVTYPAIAGFLLFTVLAFLNYLREETQRREIRDAFSSYVSPNLVQQLIDHPEQLRLGGERRELSFIFTDLAGFTSMVEKSEPSVVVSLLNEYLDKMIRIVFKHDGTIDKVVGDAINVIFSAPVVQEDHAQRAVTCALEMAEFSLRFAENKRAEGIPLGNTRIGVNTGVCMIGNFGGEAMFDYTAHGDAINTAARLESVNKHLGTLTCISANTASQCNDFIGRPVGELVLKGKTEGLEVFEPLTEKQRNAPGVQAYMEAFELLKNGSAGALEAFAKLTESYPDDPLAHFHRKRLEAGETGTRVVLAEK